MAAHSPVRFEFPHRMNKDGTIDSICPSCFSTVGRSTWEADLDRLEAAHVCDPARLASFSQHRRIVPAVSEREESAERTKYPVQPAWTQRTLRSRETA